MGFYDFPHTRNYDTDLGYLIEKYKKLNGDYNELVEKYNLLVDIYNIVKKDISNITLEELNKWLTDGTLNNYLIQGSYLIPSCYGIIDLNKNESMESIIYNNGFIVTGFYPNHTPITSFLKRIDLNNNIINENINIVGEAVSCTLFDNKIYVAIAKNEINEPTKILKSFDPVTLSELETLEIDIDTQIISVSAYKNNLYILSNSGNLYKYNDGSTVLLYNIYVSPDMARQSLSIINGRLYMTYANPKRLGIYDLESGKLIKLLQLSDYSDNYLPIIEAETVFEYDNKLLLASNLIGFDDHAIGLFNINIDKPIYTEMTNTTWNSGIYDVYIDNSYTSVFQNGRSIYPFRHLFIGSLISQYYHTVRLNLNNKIYNNVISCIGSSITISNGSIGGIIIYNSNVTLNEITIIGNPILKKTISETVYSVGIELVGLYRGSLNTRLLTINNSDIGIFAGYQTTINERQSTFNSKYAIYSENDVSGVSYTPNIEIGNKPKSLFAQSVYSNLGNRVLLIASFNGTIANTYTRGLTSNRQRLLTINNDNSLLFNLTYSINNIQKSLVFETKPNILNSYDITIPFVDINKLVVFTLHFNLINNTTLNISVKQTEIAETVTDHDNTLCAINDLELIILN